MLEIQHSKGVAAHPRPWRLLLDPPADAAWNMAVDELLLRGEADEEGTTLRFYGWSPPAVSLGRYQPDPLPEAARFCRRNGIPIVRRPTGGGGVLHADEITYSLAAPIGSGPFPRSVSGIYRRIAAALRSGLGSLGIPTGEAAGAPPVRPDGFREPCFARLGRWEICWRGRKLIGSAQARRRRRFLQHGSIPIRIDREMLFRAFGREAIVPLPAAGIADALGAEPSRRRIVECLVAGFRREFDVPMELGALSAAERRRAGARRNRAAWRDGAPRREAVR